MFSTDTHGRWAVVHPTGEVDLAVARDFRAAVLDALERADRVAIDFSEVTFMDSTGLSAIVAGLNHTRDHGGRLLLVGLSPRVRSVLETTGVERVVEIRPTVDDLDGDLAAT